MGKYFGTDGFRGEANVQLTAKHAYEIGRYIGRYVKSRSIGEKPRVLIGKDPRKSSYMYEYALSAGLTASGADAYLLHVTTTPSVSYLTRTEGFDCGIMISASHNPYTDNGIKLFDRDGGKADDDFIGGIEDYLDGGIELPYATGNRIGRTVDFAAGRNRYIGSLISLSKESFSGLKIGLDCADGSTFFIAKRVFDCLGATVSAIRAAPDGENINRSCGATCPQYLAEFVRENHLDMGFAFDGDGDRCICADETGKLRDGDNILYACACVLPDIQNMEEKKIVATVMSNTGFIRSLKEKGIGVEITRVGDKYVYEKMREKNIRLGGEQSGHIIFSKYMTTGDGILTAIIMSALRVEKEREFSSLFEGLTIFPQWQENVPVKNKKKILGDVRMEGAIYRAEERLKEAEGRLLVRPSGTEEVIRILTEGENEKLCKEVADDLRREILIADARKE